MVTDTELAAMTALEKVPPAEIASKITTDTLTTLLVFLKKIVRVDCVQYCHVGLDFIRMSSTDNCILVQGPYTNSN
jgi:hypothetical protein